MWAAILRHYDTHHKPRVERERSWFRSSSSLGEAITRAALATNERGKRFGHQRRINKGALAAANEALLREANRIAGAQDFDALFTIIDDALRDVYGVGPLYVYDTSLRISYYLDKPPARVYLHAGTKIGAKTLGVAANKEHLERHELPVDLRDRSATEVEDILCIYKGQFEKEEISARGCA